MDLAGFPRDSRVSGGSTGAAPHNGPRGRILVIDDERGIIEIVGVNLAAEGYEVLGTSDGAEGLELARTSHPDLVILDLVLPGFSGWDVLRRLRSDPRCTATPVIVLSAMTDDRHQLQGLQGGAVEYLEKPFYLEDLVAAVKVNLIAHNRALRDEHRSARIQTLSARMIARNRAYAPGPEARRG